MSTERDELADLRKKAYQATVIANDLRARAAREDERAAEYREQLGQGAGSECEELAATLNDALNPFYEPFDWHEATSIASTILAGGYRKPQTVTTPSELMSLPVGSVVLSETYGTPTRPVALQKHHGALWIPIGRASDTHSSHILPATVLHMGGVK